MTTWTHEVKVATTWTHEGKVATAWTHEPISVSEQFLLMEDGFFLLQEDGGRIILEQSLPLKTAWTHIIKS